MCMWGVGGGGGGCKNEMVSDVGGWRGNEYSERATFFY